MALAPGPPLPAIAQVPMVAAEPYGWMLRRWRRYGDVFSGRFPGFGFVTYVADPALAKQAFAGDPEDFRGGEATAGPLGPVLGAHSLLTLDGDEHMRQRKLLLPPFHGERVRRYAELVDEIATAEIERWPSGTPFRLRPAMQRITLEVILRAVFGLRDEEQLRRFRDALPRLGETAANLAMFFTSLRRDLGPLTPYGRFLRIRDEVDELLYAEIATRRDEAGEGDDVLSLLLAARDEDGQPMTDIELRDELITLLTAGHETTATALSWAFERLMRTPRVMGRAVDAADSGDDAYLDALGKEVLRLRPVVADVARKLRHDEEVGGFEVPAGTLLLPAITVLHHRPDLWERPQELRPERFIDDQPVPYSWIPFGGGTRRCIGAAFAQMELRVVLRAVLRRVSLTPVRPRAERPRIHHVTVVPRRGAEAIARPRAAGAGAGAPDAVALAS